MNKEIIYNSNNYEDLRQLLGEGDSNLMLLEEGLGVSLRPEADKLIINGDETSLKLAVDLIEVCLDKINNGFGVDGNSIRYLLSEIADGTDPKLLLELDKPLAFTYDKKLIRAKSFGQKYYTGAIRNNDLTFALGPAGTGKTFLAVLMAVEALRNKQVRRIVLVRPAVEAGEQLGFLPGDLQEKIQPYIRPLYDNLNFMLGVDQVETLIEKQVIEIAPLAYMRGRTLDDAFIILDEGQNATIEQMKMFLTRFGFRSKVVVTGDPSQNDLKKGEVSGLSHAVELLKEIEGIKVMHLNTKDVVRHPLVKEIIKAYEKGGI